MCKFYRIGVKHNPVKQCTGDPLYSFIQSIYKIYDVNCERSNT
jgi:hypothetical protein